MSLLLCLIYLLLIAVAGSVMVSGVLGPTRRHWAEVAGLSVAAGIGAMGTILFWVSVVGFAPNRAILAACATTTVVALLLLQRRRRFIRPTLPCSRSKWDARTFLGCLAALVMLAALVNVMTESLARGLADVDAYAIWMLKAKVTALQPLRPIPAILTDPSISYSHQDYPLNFPLVIAGLYAAVGAVDEQLGKLVLLPIYLALAAVLYAALRERMRRRGEAMAVTALLLSAPVLVQHAGMPVAEVLLVLAHSCCLVLLLRWMEQRQRGDLVGAGLFAVFAAFTKNEGLAMFPLVGLAALAFAVVKRDRTLLRDWLIASTVAVVLITPWLLYRRNLPRTHEDYGTKLTSIATVLRELPRLARVLPQYLGLLVQLSVAGGIWVVLLIAALVGIRRFAQPAVLVFWGLLLAHLGVYAVTFMVTPWDLDVLLPMVGPKLLLHVAPTAALLIGLHLSPLSDDAIGAATEPSQSD